MVTFYKLIISYDGTNYHGWQEQKNAFTVSGAIKRSFKKTFGTDCSIIGASRTDAGVHANGQVARIRTELELDAEKMAQVLARVLPADIVIKKLEKITDGFHPFYNVAQKTYFYHFFTDPPSPFTQRFGWYCHRSVNIEKLKQALSLFVGRHDFGAFATDSADKDTIKTVDSIQLQYLEQTSTWRVIVKGKSFLHHMVRKMVGAAIDVASRENIPISSISELLVSKNPNHTLLNAPAKGLVLDNICYSEINIGEVE